MIKLIFLVLCLLFPNESNAFGFGDFSQETITIAKAVKLGRGKSSAYSAANLQNKGGTAKHSCKEISCSAGQYFNHDNCSCSACPSGQDCGCLAAYGTSIFGPVVSNGYGGCGCPSGITLTAEPGNRVDNTACKSTPCAEGEDCGCVNRYGSDYVSDGKGGCKYDGICPLGQYFSAFGFGCTNCPNNATCTGKPWNVIFSEGNSSCGWNEQTCNSPGFECKPGYRITSGSDCMACSDQYGTGCQACNMTQCLSCKDGYFFDSASGKCSNSCPAGQYINGNTCSNCPKGEDCGCKETYDSSMSVSNGSGSCGCPESFNFTPAPGNRHDYTACKGVPCAEGENCNCSYSYGPNYVSDGKGGCKELICSAGQTIYNGKCINCPSGEDCGCNATYGSPSVSNGSGSCGCPAGMSLTPAPGNNLNTTTCQTTPCSEGSDCGCKNRYGSSYVADGKGGCKLDTSCKSCDSGYTMNLKSCPVGFVLQQGRICVNSTFTCGKCVPSTSSSSGSSGGGGGSRDFRQNIVSMR